MALKDDDCVAGMMFFQRPLQRSGCGFTHFINRACTISSRFIDTPDQVKSVY